MGHGVVGSNLKAREIVGHRHILTFSRVLVRGSRWQILRFVFFFFLELLALNVDVDGDATCLLPWWCGYKGTKIEKHPSILPHPKVAGKVGARVPLRVGRVDS
jgi:hypothetical protein